MTIDDAVYACARLVADARHIVVMTGAGVSAESGIPTFRDALTGLWAHYDPEQLATPEAFNASPALVTRWYDERRAACAHCEPNPGHRALSELQRRLRSDGRKLQLITQNVDRLHQRAGASDVIELHGSLWDWRCTRCGEQHEENEVPFPEYPPRCHCGGSRRPAVVWFGESLPAAAVRAAWATVQSCDLFLSIGTSGQVQPAASLLHEARGAGAKTVEINPRPTSQSGIVDLALRGPSGVLLPRVLEVLGSG
jgi:NAD-dependent deacetylase